MPAECTPFEDEMQRCIIQHLNQAMPMPTPTPAPTVQGVAGLWKISQSNGYHGTLDLEQGPNGQLTGSAMFNGGRNGTSEGTVRVHLRPVGHRRFRDEGCAGTPTGLGAAVFGTVPECTPVCIPDDSALPNSAP